MDNESTIRRTLESVRPLATEIIALDSGSTDSTKDILREFSVQIIDQPWLGHVKQKQAALDLCTQPWILHMDSDESLEPELQQSIREVIEKDIANPQAMGNVGGYELNRRVWWAGKMLNHAWQPEHRLRLVRNASAEWAGYDPHDKLVLTSGSAARLPGVMRHDTIPSIAEFMQRQISHARIAAESYERLNRKPSVLKLVASPVGAWLKQMVIRQAWRDGWRGWCAASAAEFATAIKHMILLERSFKQDDDES